MPHVTNIEPQPTRRDTPSEFDAFLALADIWRLSTDQQITLLGNPARSTYFKWKKQGGSMSSDTEERISHLIAIYKALQILFPEPHRADAWLERPHRFFGGRSARDVMLGGKLYDIIRVREYLDAQRGG
jgi:uncharacterized protein (DUF2384 family)